ncbi:hypothetical protein [Alteromonas sp. RW2A1]|uniref:hypothetical protein n=1 Tax=Alteromonas sp. RW2A1 TaxID=1917158 RepID=UPI0018DB8F20|nr:hypothetical protein [Alteromonas sp. RW2A1]
MAKNRPPSAYVFLIYLAEQRIGSLTFDKSTNLLKLEYESDWQRHGEAILDSALRAIRCQRLRVEYNSGHEVQHYGISITHIGNT